MTTLFADTSAVLERYMGNSAVRSPLEDLSENVVIISELTMLETFAAFARRQHEQAISPLDLTLLHNDFMVHVEREYFVTNVDSMTLLQARKLAGKYPLPVLDAIQLACALEVARTLNEPLTLVSIRQKLLKAAGAEGLPTSNPASNKQ